MIPVRSDPSRNAVKRPGLLKMLSGNRALATYIRRLPAATVVRLIDEVGLEDSQEIVAAMDAQQLREAMSVALWSSDTTGRDETLDVDRFVRWMSLWLEEGNVVFVRRVIDLGEDFIVACFRQLLVSVDRTVVGVESRGVEIGNRVLVATRHEHWPRVAEALVALWSDEPDFALRVLRRCGYERSILNETLDEHDAQNLVLQDLTAERRAARARVGHENPRDAALFLSMTKTESMEILCADTGYDLITADYLATAERRAHEATPDGLNLKDAVVRDDACEIAALDELLREAGVLEVSTEVPLLTNQTALSEALHLEQAIAALAAGHPDIASKRMRELAYLANVLMTGTESQGRRFTSQLAARTAMATANLGAAHLLCGAGSPAPDIDSCAAMLERDPGVVRLFQVGFKLITRIPQQCCEAVYQAKDVQSRRRGHVVSREMEEVLGTSVLTDLVSDGRFAEAKSVIDELSAVMDSAACVALRILLDPVPAFPCVLDATGAEARTHVDRKHRPFATLQDLDRVGSFLGSLANYCGAV